MTSGECPLSGPGKAMLKVVQYLAWSSMFGLHPQSLLFPYFCAHITVSVWVFLFLDLSGGDFLKVDVVAATVDLVVLHVPVLQL